jgi:hypothetical protein
LRNMIGVGCAVSAENHCSKNRQAADIERFAGSYCGTEHVVNRGHGIVPVFKAISLVLPISNRPFDRRNGTRPQTETSSGGGLT